ncbi:MAG: hypothetical protein ACLR07_01745 [Christensenellales bacterium]
MLSIVLCLLLSPLMAISAFLPQAMTLVPIALLLLLGYVGPVSAATCTAILFGLSTTLFGFWGAALSALLLVPVLVVSGCMVERGRGFWQSAAGSGVTMFASIGAGMLLISTLAGTDVVTAMSDMMRQAFASSGTIGDTALTAMMQFGLITAADGSAASMTMLDAATREQLIAQLVLAVDTMMRLEIPMQMATGSVAAGVLGQAALRKGVAFARRQGGLPAASHVVRAQGLGTCAGRDAGGAVCADAGCAKHDEQHVLCVQRRI